jgi:dual oxidase
VIRTLQHLSHFVAATLLAMGQHVQYLSEREIQEFTAALDKNSDGVIDYNEVQSMLDEVHHQIAEDPKPHHLHHDSRSDDATHQFLRSLMGTGEDHISTTAFKRIVEGWEVPSLEQDITEQKENRHYMQSSPLGRRLRAYWSVHGPEMMFIVLVVSMQVAFGVWQMVKYIAETQWRRALGWGVVLSKTTAGACM